MEGTSRGWGDAPGEERMLVGWKDAPREEEMDAHEEGCLWEEIDACGDGGWLTRREGCS